MSKSTPAPTELSQVNILNLARELGDGKWIEKICKQIRGQLAGNGLAELKEVPEKIKNLPQLTGAASHPAWHAAVLKLIEVQRDGKQLSTLIKVLEYLEQNVPLDATFEHLPQADFSSATASSDAIKLRLEFEQDMSRMLEAKKLDFNAVAGEDSPAIPEGTVHAIDSQVEVQLFPKKPSPKSDVDSVEDKEKGKGSASKDKRSKWVEAKVIEHDRDATTGEIIYFCWLPLDYDGQKANRSQRFKAEHVRYSALSAYKPATYLPSEDGAVKSSKLIGSDSPLL